MIYLERFRRTNRNVYVWFLLSISVIANLFKLPFPKIVPNGQFKAKLAVGGELRHMNQPTAIHFIKEKHQYQPWACKLSSLF